MPLRSLLGVPSSKLPVDTTVLVSYVLPLVVCYFALAMLAVMPRTYAVRVALWPLIASLALRAALSVDMSHDMPEYKAHDTTFLLLMCYGVARSVSWTLSKEPLKRHHRPRNSSPSIVMDGLDLALSFRGQDWEWSGRLYIPRETRPAHRGAFVFYAFVSAIVHALMCGVFHRVVLSLLHLEVKPDSEGSTLFDETLPFFVRYLRGSFMTVLLALMTYAIVQIMYDVCTIAGVLFLGQDPAQWPPVFDAPWQATSLSDFWGRRWHQFLRQVLLLVGGYPLSLVLGRTGIVIGAFLASALWHHINLLMYDSRADAWWMFVGFGMMAPGVLAEQAFHRLTGKQVGGVVGWVWTMAWLVLWGNVIFEGYVRAPSNIRSTLIDGMSPVRELVDRLTMSFDEWLHAI